MAELNVSLNLAYLKNGVSQNGGPIVVSPTVTGTRSIKNVQNIGTSDETLSLGDIGTVGYAYFHNLDATNYLIIGSDGTLYPLRLKAGEAALLRWNAAAIHAKANTAACDLEYILIED